MQGLTVAEDAASGPTTSAEALRPMEVYRTGEGVIVLSNRAAGPDVGTDRTAPITPPTRAEPVAGTPPPVDSTATASRSRASEESDARIAGLWGGLVMIVLILVAAALVAWERRRRAAAHYAALLADSEPRPSVRSGSPLPAGMRTPPAPAPGIGEPRSAPSSSGVNTPPASERQWLSQPPPRSSKDPPV